jgi:hypothetical protein
MVLRDTPRIARGDRTNLICERIFLSCSTILCLGKAGDAAG